MKKYDLEKFESLLKRINEFQLEKENSPFESSFEEIINSWTQETSATREWFERAASQPYQSQGQHGGRNSNARFSSLPQELIDELKVVGYKPRKEDFLLFDRTSAIDYYNRLLTYLALFQPTKALIINAHPAVVAAMADLYPSSHITFLHVDSASLQQLYKMAELKNIDVRLSSLEAPKKLIAEEAPYDLIFYDAADSGEFHLFDYDAHESIDALKQLVNPRGHLVATSGYDTYYRAERQKLEISLLKSELALNSLITLIPFSSRMRIGLERPIHAFHFAAAKKPPIGISGRVFVAEMPDLCDEWDPGPEVKFHSARLENIFFSRRKKPNARDGDNINPKDLRSALSQQAFNQCIKSREVGFKELNGEDAFLKITRLEKSEELIELEKQYASSKPNLRNEDSYYLLEEMNELEESLKTLLNNEIIIPCYVNGTNGKHEAGQPEGLSKALFPFRNSTAKIEWGDYKLVLNPERVNTRYFERWLASPLGKEFIIYIQDYGPFHDGAAERLMNCKIYLPKAEDQLKVQEIYSHTNRVNKELIEFSNQQFLTMKGLSGAVRRLANFQLTETMKDWYPTLPQPMANLLFRVFNDKESDGRTRIKRYTQFFEAVSCFTACAHWSILKTRSDDWRQITSDLSKGLSFLPKLPSVEATAAFWDKLNETFSARTRKALDTEASAVTELFGGSSPEDLRWLSEHQILEICQASYKIRCDDDAHGGGWGRNKINEVTEELNALVYQYKNIVTGIFRNFQLVQTIQVNAFENHTEMLVRILHGYSSTEFETDTLSIDSTERFLTGGLYLYCRDKNQLIRMLPLIKFKTIDVDPVCFFYNKDAVNKPTYISYQDIDESRNEFPDEKELRALLNELEAP